MAGYCAVSVFSSGVLKASRPEHLKQAIIYNRRNMPTVPVRTEFGEESKQTLVTVRAIAALVERRFIHRKTRSRLLAQLE